MQGLFSSDFIFGTACEENVDNFRGLQSILPGLSRQTDHFNKLVIMMSSLRLCWESSSSDPPNFGVSILQILVQV